MSTFPWDRPELTERVKKQAEEAAAAEAARLAEQAQWNERKLQAEQKRIEAAREPESPIVPDNYRPGAYRGREPQDNSPAGRFWFANDDGTWVDEFGFIRRK